MTVSYFNKLTDIAQAQTEGATASEAHLAAVGDYSAFECFHNRVLVCTYIRPNKTAGGIILSDDSKREDRFQSRCGLVLRIGPIAFKDDSVSKFGGIKIKEGDWIVYDPSDGREIFFVDAKGQGTSCRIVQDTMIHGRIDDPSKLY